MPRSVKDAKIALLNSALEIKKTEIESKINIKSPGQVQNFLDEEERTFKKMVEAVKAAGANVVVAQKGIDDVVLHYFAKEGIFAVKQVKESDLQKVARATGGKIVTGVRRAHRVRPRHGGDGRGEEGRRRGHDLHHRLQEPALGLDPHPRRDRARDTGGRALARRRAQGGLERHRGRGHLPRRRCDRDRPRDQGAQLRLLGRRARAARRRGVRRSRSRSSPGR